LPAARQLVVLPSSAMLGIPVEALTLPSDGWVISYAPSGTVLTFLQERPSSASSAGLLALGDPVFREPQKQPAPPLPDHGLMITLVLPGSNAAKAGLKNGDVLLTYNGKRLEKLDDLRTLRVQTGAARASTVPVRVWREVKAADRRVAPGELGAVLAREPAPIALQEEREFRALSASSRSSGQEFEPLPGTRLEVDSLRHLLLSAGRPTRVLIGAEAGEPKLAALVAAGELGKYRYIHLATHGVIDETLPKRSAVILSQVGLPDPLEQVARGKPVYDGQLSVDEIRGQWRLNADLVTLSACETALGRYREGEGFVGFTQALLISGARSVCLSLWKVDDTATAILMERFYENLLGVREGLSNPMPKAESLAEAKAWLRNLSRQEAAERAARLASGAARGKAKLDKPLRPAEAVRLSVVPKVDRPYAHPYYWAAFILVGDFE
jgi:hypothetical protein